MKARLELALCDLVQIMELEVWTVEDCTVLAVMIVEVEMMTEG